MRELMCLKEEEESKDLAPDSEIVLPEELPENRHAMHRNAMTEIAYSEDWKRVCVAGWIKKPKDANHYRLYLWQTALIFAGMNAVLRGENAVLAHCSVLETERCAVVLFGESGMGKSTVSGRWRAQGGKCVSDDMALLDFSGEDRIRVRRMPTWSACREGTSKWNYPADEELPLVCVLALGRSESGRDEIVPLSMAQYFAQCYRSMFYWNLFYTESLPEAMKAKLTERIRQFAEIVAKRFPPRALLTVLEGEELRAVIENNLKTH